jgi:hypothetical protein
MDLTKIEKPIALLDSATEQALLMHGGPYVRLASDGRWVDCGHISRPMDFFKGCTYRVKPKLKAFAVVQGSKIVAMSTDKDHAEYCKTAFGNPVFGGSTIVELEEK